MNGAAADPDAVLARWDNPGVPEPDLDHRSQGQKRLDGLVGACQTALTTDALPANGGHRPQILATIDYRDLHAKVAHWQNQNLLETRPYASTGSTGDGTALFAFSGPREPGHDPQNRLRRRHHPRRPRQPRPHPRRRPRLTHLPAHIRKGIMARDQGCAFPQCTMPAPWCEAHHITYWSAGGSTSTANGVLLCSYHHALIHKEHWTIEITNEVPWFKPPPELDPQRKTPPQPLLPLTTPPGMSFLLASRIGFSKGEGENVAPPHCNRAGADQHARLPECSDGRGPGL